MQWINWIKSIGCNVLVRLTPLECNKIAVMTPIEYKGLAGLTPMKCNGLVVLTPEDCLTGWITTMEWNGLVLRPFYNLA
jgi:hypothetical protein